MGAVGVLDEGVQAGFVQGRIPAAGGSGADAASGGGGDQRPAAVPLDGRRIARASRTDDAATTGLGRRGSRRADPGTAPGDASVGGWAPTLAQVEADLDAADAAEAGGLPLDKQHREGRALAQLCEHLPTDKLPGAGGVSAILTVNFDFETLAQGVRAATLSTGTRMSAGEVRRLACNAGLIPQVFDGASVPLDLGRSKRTFTIHQRRAIENRDGRCAMPGCDRPPGCCEGHHWRKPWAAGGTTDLDDLALLCGSDHRRVHAEGIPIRLQNGRLEFYMPPPAGGEKRWLSNRRFRMPPNAH